MIAFTIKRTDANTFSFVADPYRHPIGAPIRVLTNRYISNPAYAGGYAQHRSLPSYCLRLRTSFRGVAAKADVAGLCIRDLKAISFDYLVGGGQQCRW
jgi:hypothetical protein